MPGPPPSPGDDSSPAGDDAAASGDDPLESGADDPESGNDTPVTGNDIPPVADGAGSSADATGADDASARDPRTGAGDGLLADAASAGTDGESVSLSELTKRFGPETAVDGVSLDVEAGELLVLLGPSGCGKTTTLRMIAGLEAVTEGSVVVGGTDVSTAPPQERDVAMVFQNYALYPHKTVRENIRFPLQKTDLTEAEREDRIESTAELLAITDLLEKRPAALSGGQRQRVAIGRAIAREPSVLLMDEPLSNLDARLRVRTRAELRDLQQSLGITTVYVTHDQEEAMSIADRIAIMSDGAVEQVGTPEDVYEDPTSSFIAAFLGDPSMNLLPAADGTGDGLIAALAAAAPDGAAEVGVRPEDLYLVGDDGPVDPDAPATVSSAHECALAVVEPIGRAYELTLSTGGHDVVARARAVPDDLRNRDRVPVAFDEEAIYAFDREGRRVR